MGGFDPEILQDFLTESGELLDQLEGDLVELENDPTSAEMLNQIFRALHTIKGSASFLNLTNLVRIAHASESALNAARNAKVVIHRPEMDLLLAAVDLLKRQFAQLNAGQTELEAPDPALVATLVDIGEGRQVSASGTANTAAAPATTTTAASSSAAASTTTTATVAAPPAPTGIVRKPITLDDSKAVLFDHLISELDTSLNTIGAQLSTLADTAARAESSRTIASIADDLARTVEFFGFEQMLKLCRSVADAGQAAADLDAASFDQLFPRLHAVKSILDEQRDALKSNELLERPIDSLLERVGTLAEGRGLADDERLPARADTRAVFELDGVVPPEPEPEPEPAPTPAPQSVPPAQPVLAVAADVETMPADLASTPAPAPSAATTTNNPAAAPAAAPTNTDQAAAPAVEQTIRVEVGRLETLMNLVGELVLQKNRVGALSTQVTRAGLAPSNAQNGSDLLEQLEITAGTLDRITSDIQVAVMRTRMQPLEKLFGKYPRLIRDLAKKTGKNIRLEIEGGETEVDKSVIEELGDPLVHLLRNSCDHGIETPEQRALTTKAPEATLRLRASHEGAHVRVEVIDDGRGIPRDKIAKKAVERGLTTPDAVALLSDEEVFRFIFEPGFSTAEQVSDLSGRGVGMDVVRTNVEKKLKGTVQIASTLGVGTTISIFIPLTVAIMPAMMVAVGPEIYAVPLSSILEIVRPEDNQIFTIGEAPVIRLRQTVLPLLSGQQVFDVPAAKRQPEDFVVVLSVNDKTFGLNVSRVIGQQEIVIKALDGVERAGPISGATVRNDGGVSLIIDVAELVRRAKQEARASHDRHAEHHRPAAV